MMRGTCKSKPDWNQMKCKSLSCYCNAVAGRGPWEYLLLAWMLHSCFCWRKPHDEYSHHFFRKLWDVPPPPLNGKSHEKVPYFFFGGGTPPSWLISSSLLQKVANGGSTNPGFHPADDFRNGQVQHYMEQILQNRVLFCNIFFASWCFYCRSASNSQIFCRAARLWS